MYIREIKLILCGWIIIDLITVSYRELVEILEMQKVKSILTSFSCEKEPFIEKFLREDIQIAEKKRSSRSYFIFDHSKPNDLQPIGFYALSMKVFYISSLINSNNIKKFDAHKDANNKIAPIATYYIALLAKNDNSAVRIPGDIILESALGKIVDAIKLVGGRIAWVEAKKRHQKIIDFYNRNGFKEFETEVQVDYGKHEEYSHLIKIIGPKESEKYIIN